MSGEGFIDWTGGVLDDGQRALAVLRQQTQVHELAARLRGVQAELGGLGALGWRSGAGRAYRDRLDELTRDLNVSIGQLEQAAAALAQELP